ncbi:MAG: ATP-grasp domain-containing protein [Bacteroidia bacterium]|nr:ATP-grasp domain-containing protein [Bacteroidia bacterium]MCF8426958.1 ATP-grasp domain-containing protein [Bacteroidia bacterium]MCF8447603.1 ATP-grasp domain-containing protein [Bacteroidia bacterium]
MSFQKEIPVSSLPFWLQKIVYFEFWPAKVFYIPVLVYLAYLALKSRSATFFTLANPGIFLGGIKGESKSEILYQIPSEFLPRTLIIEEDVEAQMALVNLAKAQISFPLILKPDIGERGKEVEKINNEQELRNYFAAYPGKKIAQEFVQFPIELGVLYYQFPDGSKKGITSIVQKHFLQIKGNGSSKIESLIRSEPRAQLELSYLLKKFETTLQVVLPKDEIVVLEPIGNHCRGTVFLDARHLITPEVEAVFKSISQQISGFDIGRFDLKVSSLEDFKKGKNIRILELNGITSEPGHIYQPQFSLVQAYKALFTHLQLIYQIAKQHQQNGAKFMTWKSFVAAIKQV